MSSLCQLQLRVWTKVISTDVHYKDQLLNNIIIKGNTSKVKFTLESTSKESCHKLPTQTKNSMARRIERMRVILRQSRWGILNKEKGDKIRLYDLVTWLVTW